MHDIKFIVIHETFAYEDVIKDLIIALIIISIAVAKIMTADDIFHIISFEGFDDGAEFKIIEIASHDKIHIRILGKAFIDKFFDVICQL